MSIHTVLGHLAPLARNMRTSILPGGGDPALLFNAIVEGGYLVAAADGKVDPQEMSTLKAAVRAITEDELDVEDLDMLLDDLVDLRKTEGEAARCKAVGQMLVASEAAEQGLYLAAAIAYVSGGLDRREHAVMEQIAAVARVPSATLATIVSTVRDEISRRSIVAAPPRN